jgi:hypothetical protein
MLHQIYSIHDVKTQLYHKPFFLTNNATAIREFQSLVNDQTTTIGKYPSDYSLHVMGEWDDTNNQFNMKKNSASLGNGVEFVLQPNYEETNEE